MKKETTKRGVNEELERKRQDLVRNYRLKSKIEVRKYPEIEQLKSNQVAPQQLADIGCVFKYQKEMKVKREKDKETQRLQTFGERVKIDKEIELAIIEEISAESSETDMAYFVAADAPVPKITSLRN